MREIEPTNSMGRDELNLCFFPLGTSGKSQPKDASGQRAAELNHTVHVYDEHQGKFVAKKLQIRTSSKFGFCTGYESEILVGLLTLHDQTDQFASPRIAFSNSDLFKLMQWPITGPSNTRLAQGLDRLHV